VIWTWAWYGKASPLQRSRLGAIAEPL
jgi:hypothetical protein